ncbi:MAG: LamG domain-containing protein [Spirochaetota bacterium]|nr:LamG domain-containing protein [Spirochaetota bacterium]
MNNWFKFLLSCFLACSVLTQSGFSILTTNNQAYYTLNNSLLDSTGNGFTLINDGATFTPSGLIGGAYDFQDSTDHLSGTNPLANIGTSDFTVSFWFKSNTNSLIISRMFNIGKDFAGADDILEISCINGNLYFALQSNTGLLSTNTSSSLSCTDISNFHYITFKRDNNQAILYLDGNIFMSDSVEPSLSLGDADWNTYTTIGALNHVSGYIGSDSIIDEVSYWNRALSNSEILELYNFGDGLQYPYSFPSINKSLEFIDITINPTGIYTGFNFSIGSEIISPTGITYSNDFYWITTLNNVFKYYENGTYTGFSFPVNTCKGITSLDNFLFLACIDKISKYTQNGTYISSVSGSTSFSNSIDGITYFNNYFYSVSKDFGIIKSSLDGSELTNVLIPSIQNILSGITYYNNSLWISTSDGNIYEYSLNRIYTGFSFNTITEDNNIQGITSGPIGLNIVGSETDSVYEYTKEKGNILNLSNIWFKTTILNTSTNGNINTSYSLNGDSLVQACTNNLTCLFNLTLSDGYYNISFFAENNETNIISENQSFIVDITKPNIQVLQALNTTNFTINFNNVVNVTDNLSGLKSCTIDITYLEADEPDSNFLINCTDTQLFTRAGTYEGIVLAVDNAGNIATLNATGLIEPIVYINFLNINTSPIINYNINIIHPNGFSINYLNISNPVQLSPVNNGVLDLGVYNITFSKLGYQTQTISLNITDTSGGTEQNYTITESKIIINIYDRQTNSLLTGLTLITLISSIGYNSSTTTGLLNISDINFLSEQYQIIAEHTDYSTETIVFNYNNQEFLNVNMYLLNSTSLNFGTITIKAIADTGELINGAVCSALEWKSSISAYESVVSGLTNINGETILNIELNIKNYKFSCTKEGITAISEPQIIQITGSVLPIILDTSVLIPSPFLENIDFSLINTTENSTHERITFTWTDTDGLVTEGCVNVYKVKGTSKTLKSQTCASGSTSQIQILVDINQTYNTIVEAVVKINGLYTPLDSLIFSGENDISKSLKENNLALIIPFLFAIIGLVIGFVMKPQNIYMSIVGMFIGIWFGVSIVTDIIPKGTVYFISVMLMLMFWGAYKFK